MKNEIVIRMNKPESEALCMMLGYAMAKGDEIFSTREARMLIDKVMMQLSWGNHTYFHPKEEVLAALTETNGKP